MGGPVPRTVSVLASADPVECGAAPLPLLEEYCQCLASIPLILGLFSLYN